MNRPEIKFNPYRAELLLEGGWLAVVKHKPADFIASAGPTPECPASDRCQVLVVTADDRLAARLVSTLGDSGLVAERAKTMAAGCACARSGRFHVVVSEPSLPDGSWEQLAEIAGHCQQEFAVIVAAKATDLSRWSQVLEGGAFELIDVSHDLPRLGEMVLCALWIEFLTGRMRF